MTTLQMVFTKAIRASLEESGRTQKSLAEEAGTSSKHLWAVLSGEEQGSLALWDRLIKAAGVQIGWKVSSSQND